MLRGKRLQLKVTLPQPVPMLLHRRPMLLLPTPLALMWLRPTPLVPTLPHPLTLLPPTPLFLTLLRPTPLLKRRPPQVPLENRWAVLVTCRCRARSLEQG